MRERDGFPPGVPCWVDTDQPDPDAAAEFYGGLFGWTFEDRSPAGAPGRYLLGRLGGRTVAGIGTGPDGTPATAAWHTYVGVESADASAAKVTAAGGRIVVPPFDAADAGRMAVCADPQGAGFRLWEPRGRRGVERVNVPGSWNFSDLTARDSEAARTFYAAVFGWEGAPVDLGSGETTLWRVPGYGDFLEVYDPDIRKRQAEFGAPAGFEDAVAWLQEPVDDPGAGGGTGAEADRPAHWNVTFTVDDADLVAARAEALGGAVPVEPFDAGVVRMAVLRDPQGATFTVSRFAP